MDVVHIVVPPSEFGNALLVGAGRVINLAVDERGEVDFARAHGLVYQAGIVRERPTDTFRMAELR